MITNNNYKNKCWIHPDDYTCLAQVYLTLQMYSESNKAQLPTLAYRSTTNHKNTQHAPPMYTNSTPPRIAANNPHACLVDGGEVMGVHALGR